MKIRSNFLTLLGTVMLTGSAALAIASSWTIGTVHVPNWGGWGVTSNANVKTTSSNYASFNGDAIPNAFGYNVALADSNHANRSNTVGLYKDKTTRAGNNSLSINHYGYAKVYSKAVEPNSSYVKLHFSADKK